MLQKKQLLYRCFQNPKWATAPLITRRLRETWQDALFHRLREIFVFRCPAETAQFCVAHALIAVTALAFRCRSSECRRWAIQFLREPVIAFALQNGLIVHDVVNLSLHGARNQSIRKQEERGRDVVSMHLIDKAVISRINN